VEALADMYQRHIALEDESLFPLAAKILSEEDKLSIAKEMAQRRA
jgi:hemerythrin-like domain-containing protein